MFQGTTIYFRMLHAFRRFAYGYENFAFQAIGCLWDTDI